MTQADVIPISGITDVTHGGLREPTQILAEAQKRAMALIDVVEQTKSFQKIGAKNHLMIEAWVTLGQFYGCTARCIETTAVTIDGIEGFHAKAQLVHDATGQILSTAEAYCMRDEERWNTRPVYEWKDNQRTQVGSERVPIFQLASMAQTRSMARVIAAKFRWVVVLAGYAPTAAEEMTGNEQEIQDGVQPAEKPKPKAKPKPAPAFSYGKYKGHQITDPEIPVDYLQFMADSTATSLNDPAKAKFKAQNQLFLAALDAEIAFRTSKDPQTPPKQGEEPAKSDPGEAQREKPEPTTPKTTVTERKPFTETGWADMVIFFEEEAPTQYAVVKKQYGVASAHDLTKDKRLAFYDAVMAVMATEKK